MADYTNKILENHVPRKKLKSSLLVENPVPNNIGARKKLDKILKCILRDKHQTNKINLDNILEKIQGKIRDVMATLSKLLKITETVKDSKEDQVMVSMEDLLSFVEKTIALLGQCCKTL